MIHEDDSYDVIEPGEPPMCVLSEGTRQQRAYRRYSCDNRAIVTNLKTKKSVLAKITNISLNGLALSLSLDDGDKFDEVEIEVYNSDSLESFTVKGDIRYSRGEAPFIIVGVEFEKISRLSYRKIQDFIETASEYT